MTEYVAGFMFKSPMGNQVALIRKSKPEWQRGKLNGIGGKIEAEETPIQAMVREFEEETGILTQPERWGKICVLSGDWGSVHFFYSFGNTNQLRTTTEEEVVVVPVSEVTIHNCIPNLTWLIPMAKSLPWDMADSFEITEAR